ncbi:hypothetical protein [Desulfobacca acetoxidans]|uniref:Lipoprotein SmpA/OmlA domain-containing protein n=1 Tax=Desulfobacca acetoxidans (strain ATCC 700848 / DSM 11109 / ASRB2) TaxID=880072 RepID=F2NDC1_DESAR|nr:hypothetical protein [Desulfobacca acetoxidans]AEB09987.1 hypothetical protein Desac_2158 [Desulfobacca acetoxidans DSM 11109]
MKKGKTVTIGLLLLIAVMLLSAWQDITGNTINPRYVERIKNGQTTKNEIMILFGEPQQVNRTTDGVVFVYRSYRDAPVLRKRDPNDRDINPQSTVPFVLDENKQIKKAPSKTEGKILRSTLVITFKPDSQVVSTHEYTEHNSAPLKVNR